MTIAGQTVGFSDKGFTFAGTNTPIPQDNPLLAALAQAKITVRYLARIDNPDGVVSPGLVVRQEQATPGGPTMVFEYKFGQMAAHATVSGSPTSIGSELPALDTGPSDTQVISPPAAPAAPPSATTEPAALPATTDDTSSGSGYGSSGTGTIDSGMSTTTEPPAAVGAPASAPPAANIVQEAAQPISRTPMTLVDTASVYLILVAGAAVAFVGGTVLRLLGVKLKWTS